MNEYEKLIAAGVPPNVASQTIYNNLRKQEGNSVPVQNSPPAPAPHYVVVPTNKPVPVANSAPEPMPSTAKKKPGRPIDRHSRSRMLASVLLAQSYRSRSQLTLTQNQLDELIMAAYHKEGVAPKSLRLSTIAATVNQLRQGRLKGFPKMNIFGPVERTWAGLRQQVVKIESRDKSEDQSSSMVDLKLIPSWVFE